MSLKNQIVATAWALEILILLRNGLCQEPRVQLNQGVAVGIKIYADSREPIHVYLGIPYSAPRVGESRFSPPEPPPPWNRTFYANKFAPSCVQLTNTASKTPFAQDEDCLYLNIYVPEKNINKRETSVLVFIEGGGFVSGSVNNFPAQELAAEGVIVVSVNYRLNVFGFFCLKDIYARGNLGLLDQYFALLWVKDNIESFGGNKSSITLMGHSAGAASVIYHMISPRTSGYFQRAIVMSGSVLSPWSRVEDPSKCSRAIARSLGCLAETSRAILQCLRSKSVEELLRAFEMQYKNGNWTQMVLPVVDSFLPEAEQYLPRDPEEVLKTGQYGPIPVLMGTTSYEGVVTLYQWRDIVRQGYQELRSFLENSAIPNIMEHYDFIKSNSESIREIIKWQYVNQVQEGDTNGLLLNLLKFLTDTQFKVPVVKQLQQIVKSPEPVYYYIFDQPGPDLYGNIINISGAAHGSELIYLFGSPLLMSVNGRRFTPNEERFSKIMKKYWIDFVKKGQPMPGQYGHGQQWKRATLKNSNCFVLKYEAQQYPLVVSSKLQSSTDDALRLWTELFPKLSNLSSKTSTEVATANSQVVSDISRPFRSAMYTLIGLVTILLILLIVCLVILKKRSKERDRDIF